MRTVLVPVVLAAAAVACSQPPASPAAPTPSAAATSSTLLRATTGSNKNTDIAVTTSISAVDASGVAADFTSDGKGAYTNGVASVVSILTANGYNGIPWGDWQFQTIGSTTRGVAHSFDTDDEILPGDPRFTAPDTPPFWGQQILQSRLQVECTFVGKNMLKMSSGTSITCGLLDHLYLANGAEYVVQSAPSFTGQSETTDIQISCNSADSGGCNNWTLSPIGPVGSEAVGRLVNKVTTRGKTTDGNEGDFLVRFLVHVTRP